MGEQGWLKTFTGVARPGGYLRVLTPGTVEAGATIEVVHRPAHDVTVAFAYRALTNAPELKPGLRAAGDDLIDVLRQISASASA